MAATCRTCMAKGRARNARHAVSASIQETPEGCQYTLEQLQEHLFLAKDARDNEQISYTQSAINYYYVNCNAFNAYLRIPL
jgi:hypothetical protein